MRAQIRARAVICLNRGPLRFWLGCIRGYFNKIRGSQRKWVVHLKFEGGVFVVALSNSVLAAGNLALH